MDFIFEYISNTSGVQFVFTFLSIFTGLFLNQIAGKGDPKYILIFSVVFTILLLKILFTETISDRYYIHIKEFLSLPISLSIVFFFSKIRLSRSVIFLLTFSILVSQLLILPGFSILHKLIPNYGLLFSFFAGVIGFYGLWLYSINLYKRTAILIIFISSLFALLSFLKWLMPLAAIYIYILFMLFNKRLKVYFFASILVVLIATLSITVIVGKENFGLYSRFDSFWRKRVIKEQITEDFREKHNNIHNSVLGIEDGSRFYIWSYHFKEYWKNNKFIGLPLSFENEFGVPEHNIFVFYITRLGALSVIVFVCLRSYLKGRFWDKRIKNINLGLILYIVFLFSIGGLYGSSIACLFIAFIAGLCKNKTYLRKYNHISKC